MIYVKSRISIKNEMIILYIKYINKMEVFYLLSCSRNFYKTRIFKDLILLRSVWFPPSSGSPPTPPPHSRSSATPPCGIPVGTRLPVGFPSDFPLLHPFVFISSVPSSLLTCVVPILPGVLTCVSLVYPPK